jgi:hypothetical protein
MSTHLFWHDGCIVLLCWMQVLQKRRMRATMQAWFAAAAGRRDKRLAMARAGRFWAKQQLSKAWNSWCALLTDKQHVQSPNSCVRCFSWYGMRAAYQSRI